MPKWLKVVLSVFGVLLFLCLSCGGAGYLWVDQNKDRIKSSGDAAKKEGLAFAATADAGGCVDEALRRLTVKSGIIDQALNNIFLQACLEAAPKPAGFCDGVPPRGELVTGAKWAVERCSAKGRLQDQDCARMMQVVQRACVP